MLNEVTWAAILAEAEAEHPREACGVVIGVGDRERFVRFDNQADRLHQLDPVAFPRDARTAYAMDALKLSRLLDGPDALIAVVHSHPEHPSYFSETDRRAAAPFGEPTFPLAAQIVVSVYGGVAREVKGFRWDGASWEEIDVAGPVLPGLPEGAVIRGDV